MQEIAVKGDHITLGQLIKLVGPVGSGSDAKLYLMANTPVVNGEDETRRGRKLRPGDVVMMPGAGEIRLVSSEPLDGTGQEASQS